MWQGKQGYMADFTEENGDIVHSLNFYAYRPVATVGDTVRYLTGEFPEYAGRIGTVTQDDKTVLPLLVKGLNTNNPDRTLWVKYEDVAILTHGETLTAPLPNIGDKVVAYGIPLYERYEGRVATVTAVNAESLAVHGEFQSIEKPDDSINLAFTRWEPVTEQTVDSHYTTLEQQIATLTTERDTLCRRYESLERTFTTRDEQFRSSIKLISDRMNEEAINRGWCSEFSKIIGEINADLPLYELEGGKQEYTVAWTETFTVKVRRYSTYEAASEEDAIEMAQDCDTADRYMLRDAIDNGDYEYDECNDYEAEAE